MQVRGGEDGEEGKGTGTDEGGVQKRKRNGDLHLAVLR